MARERRLRARRVSASFSSKSLTVACNSSFSFWIFSNRSDTSSYIFLKVSCISFFDLAWFTFRFTNQEMAAPIPPEGMAHCSI